jgi:Uma2 family endonuclease
MVNLAYYLRRRLPTSEELPSSDETPVDNQLQAEIPNLLKSVLARIWAERQDWFFAVDMGLYYNPDEPAIVPDAFLALNVPRLKAESGRLCYVLWEEKGVLPTLTFEVVSQKYNSEYLQKLEDYQNLGILYYAIYNPKAGKGRKYAKCLPIEVYKLIDGVYQLQEGNPVWMPEIGLGIGCELQSHQNWEREWVYWYDQSGKRYLTNVELLEISEQQKQFAENELKIAEQHRQTAEQRIAELEARLRSLGEV